jgi:hypothetical protein
MKEFGIIHILVFLLLMLIYQCSGAQDFLVTSRGDTLYGSIKPLMFGVEKKVQLIDANKKKEVYSIFQVRGYKIKEDLYHPVKGPNGYTFMKLIKGGYLSLYAFQLENQVTFDGRFLQRLDGQGIEIPNLGFKKSLISFLDDCEAVVTKIERGDLTKKDTEQIVSEYNNCIRQHSTKTKAIAVQPAPPAEVTEATLDSWNTLESKVKEMTEFEGRANALEMITEIRSKISKGEKVPNFLVQGLKATLNQPELQEDLTAALAQIK